MINKDIFELEEENAKKKEAAREKKKKPKMKISGRSVFGLQKIMREKIKSKK
ncbi:MAG: hypothetical protein U9P63_02520 [Patescibacteria group bacterium]|nr:hypothetical protein [Patescibacteria group bacterium]